MNQVIKKRGFTLIELLVVIAIIGILATIAIVSLQQARQNARDAKRIADVKQMMTALELYFNDNQQYPPSSSLKELNKIASGSIYMAILPQAPTPADGNCQTASNTYTYSEKGVGNGSYILSFCLGKQTGGLAAGPKCATPGGILNADCSSGMISVIEEEFPGTSGIFIDPRDNQEYNWVKINNRVWMAENLNIGERINTCVSGPCSGANCTQVCSARGTIGNNQSNNSVIEKYCYNDDENYCDNYGGFYQWNEAMQYSTEEGSQGICPVGWTIPSDENLNELKDYISNSGYSGVEGVALKSISGWLDDGNGTDNFGFTALPAGSRASSERFNLINEGARFWSSSLTSSDNYFIYSSLNYDLDTFLVGSVGSNLYYGLSIRCLKN